MNSSIKSALSSAPSVAEHFGVDTEIEFRTIRPVDPHPFSPNAMPTLHTLKAKQTPDYPSP